MYEFQPSGKTCFFAWKQTKELALLCVATILEWGTKSYGFASNLHCRYGSLAKTITFCPPSK
jgi:hypothetical protein